MNVNEHGYGGGCETGFPASARFVGSQGLFLSIQISEIRVVRVLFAPSSFHAIALIDPAIIIDNPPQ